MNYKKGAEKPFQLLEERKNKVIIKQIDTKLAEDFILNKHYAQRKPSVSWCFGLYSLDLLIGILTVGKPASNSLCKGVCGIEVSSKVYELNRLVIDENLPPNTLSFFVGKCLKLLKKEDIILVSYSDMAMKHHGFIYQATNWIYTGKTVERTDKYVELGKHSRHYTDEFNHLRVYRSSKHRYIYFTGKSKKMFLEKLNYKIQDYPKGDNKKYKFGDRIKRIVFNKLTQEKWEE
ncbi:MAG: hypothetical protein ACRC6E_11415 [Fusobacteriaceae bacterium]